MLHKASPYDLGISVGVDIGRTQERLRIKSIMGLPEAEMLSVDAAKIALETGLAVPDAQRTLAQLATPARKGRAAR